MKLVPQKEGGSFYESFSDLIFGTLIIFIVLVMGLAMEMKDVEEKAVNAVEDAKKETARAAETAAAIRVKAADVRKDGDRIRAEAKAAKEKADARLKELDVARKAAEKARSETATARNLISRLVKTNRFTGGADETLWTFTPVAVDGKPHMWIVPAKIVDAFDMTRNPDVVDPVLETARCVKGVAPFEDGLLLLSPEQFRLMEGGVNRSWVSASVYSTPGGSVVTLMHAARRLDVAAWNALTPEKLRDRVGGPWLFEDADRIPAGVRRGIPSDIWPAYEARAAAVKAPDGPMFNTRFRQVTTTPLLRASPGTPAEPAWIKFGTTADRRITVGKLTMSAGDFRNLLRAMRPGRGFYVEYLSADGKPDQEPPKWVMEEVLRATGFDTHVVDEAALRGQRAGGP